jgi:imidazolonepropionase-like amidohydrolase
MPPTLIHNATVIDATGAGPQPGRSVVVQDGRIVRIGPADAVTPPGGATRIDASGRFLLPGLTDAHVHLGLTEPDGSITRPWAAYAVRVAAFIEEALDQGFTTVRDAGGLDPAWAGIVRKGLIRGPRILPSGAFLSQTGGHGDWRPAHSDYLEPLIPGLIAGSTICDGPDEVRKAAREQLRRGATQIKVMASGGAASPTDPIDAVQFTIEELRAAVEEARARNTYVLAHAYHPASIENCIEAGVRSIEHGNLLDEATARRIAAARAFLVPTLITFEVLREKGAELGLSPYSIEKIELVAAGGEEAVRIAARAGVRIASGSDLLGPPMALKARELVIKARILGPMEAIISATRTNAELFQMEADIGAIEEGKLADLILVDRDPLAGIEVLTDPERVRLVMKAGETVKDLDNLAG